MPQIPSKHAAGPLASPAIAIRRLVVPLAAPPYDDDPEGQNSGRNGHLSGQGGPTPRRALAAGLQTASRAPRVTTGAPPAGSTGSGGWPSQFAQILAETLAGSRPAQQLAPWTTEQARRQIRQLGPVLATGQRPRVRRIMASAPASDVLELTAVVGFGPRTRVLAVRLEREHGRRGGWCCTAIDSA